ncbi:MAG: DUF2934 domain-containing protein [Rhizobiaceae bacterium]|nr:MAG: DUF2934 domain-containing protein [Rhizobiaceae bacterium]
MAVVRVRYVDPPKWGRAAEWRMVCVNLATHCPAAGSEQFLMQVVHRLDTLALTPREKTMALRPDHKSSTRATTRRPAGSSGDGELPSARQDPDVMQLLSDEVDSSVDDWHGRVCDAAYFRAEKRGFAPGRELEDWLAAEQDIAELPGSAERQ